MGDAADTVATTDAAVGTESPKVTRFLALRYATRTKWAGTKQKLEKLQSKLDPRSTIEDYLRRKTRIEDTIAAIEDDPVLSGDAGVTAAMRSATDIIAQCDNAVAMAESEDKRPAFGDLRDALQAGGNNLDKAIAAARKSGAAREEKNPELARKLEAIGNALDDPIEKAPEADIKNWRARYNDCRGAFFSAAPDFKQIDIAADLLVADMRKRLGDVGRARGVLEQRRSAALAAMARAPGTVDEQAEISAMLNRAQREIDAGEFGDAAVTLTAAEKALPSGGAATPPPTAVDAERRRAQLEAFGPGLLRGKPPKAPTPEARERVTALVQRLKDDLRPMCRVATDAVATEVMRHLDACDRELQNVAQHAGEAEAFANDKQADAEHLAAGCKRLKSELAAEGKARGVGDGATTEIGLRLANLEQRLGKDLPRILTREEFDDSGLMLEYEMLDGDFETWRKTATPEVAKLEGWQGAYHSVCESIRDKTTQAAGSNAALLASLGLLSQVPKMMAEGDAVLNKDGLVAEPKIVDLTAELQKVLSLLTANLTESSPDNLNKLRAQAEAQAAALQDRIAATTKLIEGEQPGKVSGFFKKGVKKATFGIAGFKNDAERALQIELGTELKDTVEAVLALVNSGDIAAVRGTIAELDDLDRRIRDLESMAQRAAKPNAKAGPDAPPLLGDLLEDITKLTEKVDDLGKDKKFATRASRLKEWGEKLAGWEDNLISIDPRALQPDVAALKTEIGTAKTTWETEIKTAETQAKQATQLVLDIMDARGKRSFVAKPYGAYLKQLQREAEALKDRLETQLTPEDVTLKQLQDKLKDLLDANRADDKTNEIGTAQSSAVAEEKRIEAARRALLLLRDSDLKLRRERYKENPSKKARGFLRKLAADLSKKLDRGIAAPAENRDAGAAEALAASVTRELDQAESGPQGDHFTARKRLRDLDVRWRGAVTGVREQLNELASTVVQQAQEADDLVRQAAGKMKAKVFDPVSRLFDVGAFTAAVQGMEQDDDDAVADAREAALREVRRLRRVMDNDNRVRMLALSNPFGVEVPFVELSNALSDIELNVTRAT